MSRWNKESGQALVLAVTTLGILLIGIAGLGVDTGYYRYQKRLMQTAADAAAIAGASNLCAGCTGVISGALAAATLNGFTDTSGGTLTTCTNHAPTTKATSPPTVCVVIKNGPISGPHTGDNKYVEAYVSVVEPTFFMSLLGTYSEPITARAVATYLSGASNSGGCLYTLGSPTAAIEGINMNGHNTLSASGCGIDDNGDFSPPSSGSVTAGTIAVSGTGSSNNVTCSVTPTSCPTFGTPAAANPLAYLTPPTVGTPTAFSCPGVPGTYTSISNNHNCSFAPGIYVLTGGGFACHGNANLTGTGVMFYLTNGANWDCSGGDSMSFTAPSPSNCPSCPAQYDGIVVYQDPSDTNGATIGGNAGSFFDGALYLPSADVEFHGTPSDFDVGIVVAASLTMKGTASVTLQGTAGLPTGVNLIKNAILVE